MLHIIIFCVLKNISIEINISIEMIKIQIRQLNALLNQLNCEVEKPDCNCVYI